VPVIHSADPGQRLDSDLRHASERVKHRFAGRVEDPVVDDVVYELARELAGARVKDYVGILVERMSVDRLKSMLVPA